MSTLKVGTIQDHANSNTAMSIDSSGRVTTPARPTFKARPSSTTSIAINNDIVFGDVTTSGYGLHNIGGHYNTSNGIFTAPVAGVYFFQYTTYQNGVTGAEVDLMLNGTAVGVAREFGSNSMSYNSLNHAQNLLLAASDQVKCRVVVGTAYVNVNVSSFSGFLIG